MSFLGRLFGTEKALNAVVEGVSSGLDKLVFTDEEKAEAAAKERTEARAMVVQWMQATQGQNLARRLIALSITGIWLSQYVFGQMLSLVNVFLDKAEIYRASDLMRDGANDMNTAVMLILGFYFAAPHMGKIADAALARMAK